ncbi:MAG: M23 family metallopeptidase [Sterolibacterium sp.]|nr:M23 family metallopeptidase [Sterolibacterium sp.]
MNKEKIRILTQLDTYRAAHPGPFWATVGVACVSMFGMVAAFGTAPSTVAVSIAQQTVVEQLAPAIALSTTGENETFVREDQVQRGDSVASLLARLGVQDDAAFRFLRDDKTAQILFRQLRPGKNVTAHVGSDGELQSLIYPLNASERALFIERHHGKLQASERALPLETQTQMKSGEIQFSLFEATDDAGVPDHIAMQLIDLFGGDIDFHRDLRKGDRFSVVYETRTHLGKPVRTGRILAAEFVNAGKTYRAVWFADQHSESKGSYYTAEGKSLRKAFLRSPLEFSRISSGFTTARFHPVLQTWRAHKGVDYAAPTGTRVKSTADGTVDFVGNQTGFGRVVILKHQARYSTVYGHLSGFAAGLHKGSRVAQGEIIGYVGSSGWATGPHLHYEFRIDNLQHNPLSVALPTTQPLNTAQLAAFRSQTQPWLARLELIRNDGLALLD